MVKVVEEYLLAGFVFTVVCAGLPQGELMEPGVARDVLAVVTSFAGCPCGRSAGRLWAVAAACAREGYAG